jgi:phosphoribosylamine--glycine ligase
MRVLVVGGGGREHALVWKLRQSPRVEALFCAPGNAGIVNDAECVPIKADDVRGLLRFASEERIDLTVVGPELPLTLGLVDRFTEAGLRAFGPTAAAARLEGSKAFAKELLRQLRVPTAFFGVFTDADDAVRYVEEVGAPVVVKADGLASGKGVYICPTVAAAREAIDEVMRRRLFGDAGAQVVVEEFLEGEEVSFMALSDGTTVVPLATSQDHKRAYDGDRGPNTGGMGAYSPAPIVTPALEAQIMREIIEPVVQGLARQGVPYTGILYAGLMVHEGRAKVLEFNVRFGDPEAQVLLFRLRSDLVDLVERVCTGTLAGAEIEWDPRPAVCVVLAAEGYPGAVEKGRPIKGLTALRAWREGVVFHAGTRVDPHSSRVVTDGGRVLGVTARGDTVARAASEAYTAVARIDWPGMHYRRDIGHRAIGRTAAEEGREHGGS